LRWEAGQCSVCKGGNSTYLKERDARTCFDEDPESKRLLGRIILKRIFFKNRM
jgi:hypothetical protein